MGIINKAKNLVKRNKVVEETTPSEIKTSEPKTKTSKIKQTRRGRFFTVKDGIKYIFKTEEDLQEFLGEK